MDHLTVAGQLIGGGCVAETFVAFGFALRERIDFAVICYPRHDCVFLCVSLSIGGRHRRSMA